MNDNEQDIIDVVIPYHPRKYQDMIHRKLKRYNVIVAHRRFGKSVLCINQLIYSALNNQRTSPPPRYAYIAPTYKMAKNIVWDMLKFYVKDIPGLEKKENELSVTLPNGAKITLYGADYPDALRGIYLDGVVIDEIAMCPMNLYGEVIRITLSDYEGWVIFIGCVAPDTMILGENGIQEIGQNEVGYSASSEKLYGLDGWHDATDRYGTKFTDTIKIKTSRGFELEATPNHRIWTPNDWVRMDELKIGSPIHIQHGQNIFGTKRVDNDFAYLLGLYLAEGNIEDKIYRLTITNQDAEIRDWLKGIGFTTRDGIHHRRNSKELIGKIREWFPDKQTAPYKTLSPAVLSLCKESLKHLLAGYFDGDGCADKQKRRVSCCSSSEKLSRQIQILLLNFGIVASRSVKITPPTKKVKVSSIGHRLSIDGASAFKFFNDIGFRLTRKQNQIEHNAQLSGHDLWFNRKDFGQLPQRYSYLTRCKTISQTTLANIAHLAKKKYDPSLIADEIVEIKPSQSRCSDFVIPDTHQYFTGGFISHNTPKGKNHFHKLYMRGITDRDWYCDTFPLSRTKVLSNKEINEMKKDMTPSEIAQELECSFDTAGNDSLIPLEWILACQKHSFADEPSGMRVCGIDVARYGKDSCSACIRQGHKIIYHDSWHFASTVYTSERVESLWRNGLFDSCNVDGIGIGGGVVDQLRQKQVPVFEVNVASASTDSKTKALRDALWWKLRGVIETKQLQIPNDAYGENLVIQLSTPTYEYAGSKIKVKSKQSLRDRAGNSPDDADALCLTYSDYSIFTSSRVMSAAI